MEEPENGFKFTVEFFRFHDHSRFLVRPQYYRKDTMRFPKGLVICTVTDCLLCKLSLLGIRVGLFVLKPTVG